MTRARTVKRKDHCTITWTPAKPSIFHAQTLDWSKEFGDEGERPGRRERNWKAVVWPEQKGKGWSWRRRLVSRWVNRDQQLSDDRVAARPRKFLPVGRLKRPNLEILKGLNLPAVDWLAVVWGWVASLAITLAVLAAAAFYVAFTPGSVYYLSTYLFLNKVVSPLLGGILAGVKAKQAAGLVGLWVGLGYGIIVLVFRLYGGLFSLFWTEALASLAASLAAGLVGAVLGAALAATRESRGKRKLLAEG